MKNTKRIVYGINPINQAIEVKGNTCYKLILPRGKLNPRLQDVVSKAQKVNIQIEKLPKAIFQKKYLHLPQNQGVVGYFSSRKTHNLEDLITDAFLKSSRPVLAILDSIQDPQNLGAIVRSAEALGLQGIIIPKHRASPLNATVAKSSSGAVEKIPIAQVNNLATSLETLKSVGFWTVGVTPDGEKSCYQFQFDMPTALIVGGERKGIRPILRKKCDHTIRIPMKGETGSLNVSVASAILFYEVMRPK